MKKFDSIIIGAGPAGLAAAIELYNSGLKNILLIERNPWLGGILKQCIHTGFGLTYFNENLTGPEYAALLEQRIKDSGIPYQSGTMAINLTKDLTLTVSSREKGPEQMKARSIIISTGCRERTRENLEIAGSRPAGIFTAGQAQTLINLKGYHLGRNVVIQGTGDVGMIMARRLKIEGYNVIRVLERLSYLSGLIRNKVQCLDDFAIPVSFSSEICEIKGQARVTGVVIQGKGREKEYLECDTVLFSVGLIPELELAKRAGLVCQNDFSALVNSHFEANVPGLFICGNSLHIHDLADNASLEGEMTARQVAKYLKTPRIYKKETLNSLPYQQKKPETKFNSQFFTNLEKESKIVCIICPKGCPVSDKDFTCQLGQEFYLREKTKKLRQLTTSLKIQSKDGRNMIPIKSEKEIDIKNIPELKSELNKITYLPGKSIEISIGKNRIRFLTKEP